MERADLVTTVRQRAALNSDDAAAAALVATLQTLGEHVSAGQAEDLAASLPDDLEEAVTDRSDESPEDFSVDEFLARVADRERRDDVDDEAARQHVRAVMAALADAGLAGELRDAREQLPNEFATLFEPAGE